MRTLRLRDAKASLSAVVEAAERGEATTITKYGKPAAVVMPVEDARRAYPADRPSFAALLMRIPTPWRPSATSRRSGMPICDRLAARHQRSECVRTRQADRFGNSDDLV